MQIPRIVHLRQAVIGQGAAEIAIHAQLPQAQVCAGARIESSPWVAKIIQIVIHLCIGQQRCGTAHRIRLRIFLRNEYIILQGIDCGIGHLNSRLGRQRKGQVFEQGRPGVQQLNAHRVLPQG